MELFRKPAHGLPDPGLEPAQFEDLRGPFFHPSVLFLPESARSLLPEARFRPFVEGQIAGDRHEPGREGGPLLGVKAIDIPIRSQECFLGQILVDLRGEREIPQVKEDHPLVAKDEDLEGVRVSLSGLFDKKPVVHELGFFPFPSIIPLETAKVPPDVLDTRPGPDYVRVAESRRVYALRKKTIPVRRCLSARETIRKEPPKWDGACRMMDGERL